LKQLSSCCICIDGWELFDNDRFSSVTNTNTWPHSSGGACNLCLPACLPAIPFCRKKEYSTSAQSDLTKPTSKRTDIASIHRKGQEKGSKRISTFKKATGSNRVQRPLHASLRPLRLNQLRSFILRTRLLHQPNKETRRFLTGNPLLENRHQLAKRNPLFWDRSFHLFKSRKSSRHRSGRSGARSSRSAGERCAVA
jgi:hypothetical protein